MDAVNRPVMPLPIVDVGVIPIFTLVDRMENNVKEYFADIRCSQYFTEGSLALPNTRQTSLVFIFMLAQQVLKALRSLTSETFVVQFGMPTAAQRRLLRMTLPTLAPRFVYDMLTALLPDATLEEGIPVLTLAALIVTRDLMFRLNFDIEESDTEDAEATTRGTKRRRMMVTRRPRQITDEDFEIRRRLVEDRIASEITHNFTGRLNDIEVEEGPRDPDQVLNDIFEHRIAPILPEFNRFIRLLERIGKEGTVVDLTTATSCRALHLYTPTRNIGVACTHLLVSVYSQLKENDISAATCYSLLLLNANSLALAWRNRAVSEARNIIEVTNQNYYFAYSYELAIIKFATLMREQSFYFQWK